MKPGLDQPLWKQTLNSVGYAFAGMRLLLSDRNIRFHLVCGACVIGLGLWLQVSGVEWIALALSIALVMSLEAMNTAVELVVDLASPKFDPIARDAKDVAAAAVMIAAMGAAVVGLIIFVPRLSAILF